MTAGVTKYIRERVARLMPRPMLDRLKERALSRALPSYDYLRSLMLNYQVKDLVNATPESFKNKLDGFLGLRDHEMEGFENPDRQRDLTVKFHWGHNHDFGDFYLQGRMGDRHIALLARFIDEFQAVPRSLDGLRVLDIGCWTGGTSLLLCAMGAHVVAIEEVKKYVDSLDYLKHAFALDRLEPRHLSLYECTTPELQDAFDIVFFAGVLYHITDPVLALRITFNCLKNGGVCLAETEALSSGKRLLSYEGPSIVRGGSKGDLSRGGWNWFFPSSSTLAQMMSDVGYTDIRASKATHGRVFAVGRRETHVDMMRSGLSVKNIR
jgi:SAM-dependent methyltransferase